MKANRTNTDIRRRKKGTTQRIIFEQKTDEKQCAQIINKSRGQRSENNKALYENCKEWIKMP